MLCADSSFHSLERLLTPAWVTFVALREAEPAREQGWGVTGLGVGGLADGDPDFTSCPASLHFPDTSCSGH